jgi:hypothetical protein
MHDGKCTGGGSTVNIGHAHKVIGDSIPVGEQIGARDARCRYKQRHDYSYSFSEAHGPYLISMSVHRMAYTSLTVTCDSLESLWLAQTLTL